MSSVVIAGDISGSVTLQAPVVAGLTTLTLPAVSGTVLTSASDIPTSSITGVLSVSQGGTGVSTAPADVSYTGTGATVRNTSPVLVTPALGTPASGNLSNCTGFPVAAATTTGVTAPSGTSTTQLATTEFACGTSSKSSFGYTKLPNGIIMQWGTVAVGANGTAGVTLPIAMPNAGFQVIANGAFGVRGDLWGCIQGGYFANNSTVYITNGWDQTMQASWFAIGH
jgi:hypothetical protein